MTASLIIAAFALHAPQASVPAEIKTRYKEIQAAISKCDLVEFQSFFSLEFVSVDPSGTKTSVIDFFDLIRPVFDNSVWAKVSERLISAETSPGSVAVKFEMHIEFNGKDGGMTKIHEIGTDYWRKENGKYVLFKTVDKVMEFSGG